MMTSPACSKLVSCTDRFPLLSRVIFWRNIKSADAQEESTVRIASRAGSCISRFGEGIALSSLFILALCNSLRQLADQDEVIVQTHRNQAETEPASVQ